MQAPTRTEGDRGDVPVPLPPPPASRPPGLGARAAMAAATIGVVAVVAATLLRLPDVELPGSFGGLTRTTDAVSEAAASSFRTASDARDLEADMGFYGSTGVPEVALAWIRGSSPGGAASSFDGFTAGFTADSGGVVVTAERVERTLDGVLYVCAPVSGPVSAGICMWEDGDVSWILMDVRPGSTIAQARSLAVAAHDAI